MKKIYLTAAALLLAMNHAAAQDIYKVEKLTGTDLNGDARYVGMGGAMSALGANISAMSTNPASTALYRRNDFSVTGSLFTQSGKDTDAQYLGTHKLKTSLDQAGFVYSLPLESGSMRFVSLGFNYRKTKNFANVIGLNRIPLPNGMSQTWQLKQLSQDFNGNWLDFTQTEDRAKTTPLTRFAADALLLYPQYVSSSTPKKLSGYETAHANAYYYGRAQWGSNQAYDFNLAFNFSEQFYFGVNLGLYNVNFHQGMEYEEESFGNDGKPFTTNDGKEKHYIQQIREDLTGTGVDAKFGVIVRPISDSPFRLGVSVTTPTLYSLESTQTLYISSPYDHTDAATNKHYEFTTAQGDIYTNYHIVAPWKANFSLGTTVGNYLALGAEYEITDHTSAQVRNSSGNDGYYDWSTGVRDQDMQTQIERYTRDTHTIRLGAELRATNQFSFRIGYNFVSAPFSKDAYLNLFTQSPTYQYAAGTDYVNLRSTNRLTFGIGYHDKHFYADAAYLYQHQGADVYAFHYNGNDRFASGNELQGEHINLLRHSFLLTLGYRF